VVLLIGERYGYPQPSGLSATHEEYREAGSVNRVLIFVESAVVREPAQQAFLDEVPPRLVPGDRCGGEERTGRSVRRVR
jgi:hypothetical protein